MQIEYIPIIQHWIFPDTGFSQQSCLDLRFRKSVPTSIHDLQYKTVIVISLFIWAHTTYELGENLFSAKFYIVLNSKLLHNIVKRKNLIVNVKLIYKKCGAVKIECSSLLKVYQSLTVVPSNNYPKMCLNTEMTMDTSRMINKWV